MEKLTSREVAQKRFKPEMFDQLKALSDAGEPSAVVVMCAVLQWGIEGREMDQQGAAELCPKAADSGDPAGHAYNGDYLTNSYMYDMQIDRDKTELAATAEFGKASELGHGPAEVEYARRLHLGEGITADPPRSVDLLKIAQAHKAPGADYELGMVYFSGKVPGPDAEEAFALLKKSADEGYPPAQFDLCDRLVGDSGWEEDLDAALVYCKGAATAADPQIGVRAQGRIPDVEKRIAARDAARAGQPAPN
jgi:TPR repeat protein